MPLSVIGGGCCCLVTKSCPTLLWHYGVQPTRFACLWDFPGKNTEVVVICFSRGYSWLRDWTCISCLKGRLYHYLAGGLSAWVTCKAHVMDCVFVLRNFSSVQSLSRVPCFVTPWITQHARPPCPSPTPGVLANSCPLSRWCHPAISSSVVPFSSCPQSLPASGSFPMSQLFAWGGQSIGVSASASVLPMNTQDWCPLGWTGWISLQSKGLSRVFSNTTV